MFATSLWRPGRPFEQFNPSKPGPHGLRPMMCPPSRPESQSDDLLGFSVSKHSSTYHQFSNPPLLLTGQHRVERFRRTRNLLLK